MAVTARYGTVGDALAEHPELSTFNQLVRRSGVIVDLDDEGPFTVFAPTNEAFAILPEHALGRIVKDPHILERFVRHHIVVGRVEGGEIAGYSTLPTMIGVELSVMNVEPGPWVGGVRVVDTDIGAANGIVHTIASPLGID